MLEIAVPPVRERGMLYSSPMVLGLLADTKTQTRRALNAQPNLLLDHEPRPVASFTCVGTETATDRAVMAARDVHGKPVNAFMEGRHGIRDDIVCPYGAPGDRLWVRETFYAFGRWETRFSAKKGRDEWHFIDLTLDTGHAYSYVADGAQPALLAGKRDAGVFPKWWKRPAIHMPRVASRIDLEITEVRVERLQAISEEDARAEGVYSWAHWLMDNDKVSEADIRVLQARYGSGLRAAYAALWESINGDGSWALNPWAWAVSFTRIKP